MTVLFVLVPVALVLVAVALGAFRWAVGRGQFDDLITPGLRVLREDEGTRPVSKGPQARLAAIPEGGLSTNPEAPISNCVR